MLLLSIQLLTKVYNVNILTYFLHNFVNFNIKNTYSYLSDLIGFSLATLLASKIPIVAIDEKNWVFLSHFYTAYEKYEW